jgi:phosphonate metabolism-associated iron-containing alcohol dehydrogenase
MLDDEWLHGDGDVRVVSAKLKTVNRFIEGASSILLVTTPGFVRRGVVDEICAALGDRKVHILDSIRPNPDMQTIERSAVWAATKQIDAVIALGGGSAIDAAKVLALLLANPAYPSLERILKHPGEFAWGRSLPLVAIPTTAGTGAEVTPFATVWDMVNGRKFSLADPHIRPDIALLDASLLGSLPASEFRWSGLDTISHALESIWNRNATKQSRSRAFKALSMAVDALPQCLAGSSGKAVSDMQIASTLAGLAIAETRTALAHSISYPITARFGVPHGLACSFTLLPILRRNQATLHHGEGEQEILEMTRQFLESVAFPELVRDYLSFSQLISLKAEMITPGRADNYSGAPLPNLDDLLTEAVAG